MADNHLFFGDNLDILRRYIKDESVDLVYLDPPFNSNANYNVLFAEKDGKRSAAQIKAFTDTWTWDEASARTLWEVIQRGGPPAQAMQAFRILLGENDMLAYLAMMAPRLIELRRVLKPTGTIWLHCDPTASHYLKVLMDAIFEPRRFLNEVSWRRSSAHNDTRQGMRRCGKVHDVLLAYSKTSEYTWNAQYLPYTKEYLESEYRHRTPDGRYYKETDLTAAKPGGDVEYEWRVKRKPGERFQADVTDEYLCPQPGWEYAGVTPYNGRYWAYSRANLVQFANDGRLIHRKTGMPRLMQFADDMPGIPLQDVWDDIAPASGNEDLDYPTQKPEVLLERIINASSNTGDVVLDPFCGCGTAVIAAQKLSRRWIGIDITHLAVGLMKTRLRDSFGPDISKSYDVTGEPTSLPDAVRLAEEDKFQFQAWALGLVEARPDVVKKGADRGVDGRLFFHEGDNVPRQVILSVKGGHLRPDDIRALGQVVTRENADIGVLITLEEPTAFMRADAASGGFYTSPWGTHPRLQILTIRELLDGKKIDMPHTRGINTTFKQAPKAKAAVGAEQRSLMEA